MIKTILFVDPDVLFVEKMRQHFLAVGYRVICADKEAEAESIIAATRPDVVISEIMLEQPDSGFTLAYKVKQKYPDVPVIIISAVTWHTGLYFSLATPEDRAWIKADALLEKPIRGEELEATLHRVTRPAKAA